MVLRGNNIVEKRNILNEMRCNSMSLQELRFFTIYLSRIDARNAEKTRIVRFLINDFMAIMELKNINISRLKQATNNLLCKIVNIPIESGGYTAFQLFKKCTIYKDKNDDQWYMCIDAHDDALPLMFDFKRDYFTYELWNALSLTSANQLRMYEILKQYQKVGERTVKLEQLKQYLFIEENEYFYFSNFRIKVLDACQKALKDNTDLYFEYELIKKAKGKVHAIKFNIFVNEEHKDPITLNEFIDIKINDVNKLKEIKPVKLDRIEYQNTTEFDEKLDFLSEACNDEFSAEEMRVLYNLLVQILPYEYLRVETKAYDFLKRKYEELLWRASKTNITHRFSYLKKILEAEVRL